MAQLVKAYLTFDVRYSKEALLSEEREEIERDRLDQDLRR